MEANRSPRKCAQEQTQPNHFNMGCHFQPETKPAPEQYIDYDAALIVLGKILSVYDVMDDETKLPQWADAISLQILDWGREEFKAQNLYVQDIEVIAKKSLQELISTILIDPVDRKPLKNLIIYDGVAIEDEFAQQYLGYHPDDKPLLYHTLAMTMKAWSSAALLCFDNEYRQPNQDDLPEPSTFKAPELKPELNLVKETDFGADLMSDILGEDASVPSQSFKQGSEYLPQKLRAGFYKNKFDHVRFTQNTTRNLILKKWGSDKMLKDSKQRLKDIAKVIDALRADKRQESEDNAQKWKKRDLEQEKEVVAVKKEMLDVKKKYKEVQELQLQLLEEAIKLQCEISNQKSLNSQLQHQLQEAQRNNGGGGRGGCIIF